MAEETIAQRLLGERVGGRFVVERLIGEGPLSSAFRARDELLQRRVTVKLFHPAHADDAKVVESQLELAISVARLSHPNIATVIDRGEHDGMPFIVLEHVRGENLQERIERFAPLRIGEVVGYGIEIARALAYAHAQGVVHGNLRPANVLISEDHESKLVDFGGGSFLARLTGDAYAPPEIMLDEHAADAAAEPEQDIYGLGAVLFAALTEERPVPDIDASRIQMLRPDASPRLAQVIARALTEDPHERYGSMHEMATDLSAVRLPAREKEGLGGVPVAAPVADETQEWNSEGATELFPLAPAATPPSPAGGGGRARRSKVADSRRDAPPSRDERRARRRQRRARILAWGMVLVPVAILVVVGVLIVGEGTMERQQEADPDKQSQPNQEVGEFVRLIDAQSFDPPPGDGSEHEDEHGLMFDKKDDTAWSTETYQQNLGIGKPGVGFWVRPREPQAISRIEMASESSGWKVQVYATNESRGDPPMPPTTLEGWTPVSEEQPMQGGGDHAEVDTGDESYAFYLVWITALPYDQEVAGHRVRISEVELFGVE